MKLNRRKLLSLMGMSPALLATSPTEAQPKKKAVDTSAGSEAKVTALSPKGVPPPTNRVAMAPRPSSINGTTIYLVDTGFMGADVMIKEVGVWFQQNMPSVTIVTRKKAGTYPENDPPLWAS